MQTTADKAHDDPIYRKDRKCTDVIFLIFFLCYFIGLFLLVLVCAPRSDIFRIIYGYDDCGNICGRNNPRNIGLPCSGQNMLNKKILLLTVTAGSGEPLRSCVERCEESDGFQLFFNRCIRYQWNKQNEPRPDQSYVDEFWEDLSNFYGELLGLCGLAFLGSLVTLMLLWCASTLMIVALLLATVGTCLAGTAWLWTAWREKSTKGLEDAPSYLGYAVGSSVASVLVCLIIAAIWKKVSLVVHLLNEAGDAIRSMWAMFWIPVLNVVALLCTFMLASILTLTIEATGEATLVADSVLYVKDRLTVLTRWYNVLAFFWFCQFLCGCQHVVTAGVVSAWYFTRDKSQLGRPLERSFFVLTRYHLGSVALGSLLMATVQLVQWVLKILWHTSRSPRYGRCCANCCLCCVGCLRALLQPIGRNAYIVTALRGTPFCTSGKRAIRLLGANAGKLVALGSIGSVILVLAKLFVVALVAYVGLELVQRRPLYHPYFMLVLAGAIAYLMAHCFLMVFEDTIDTIFLCFCKDIEVNDGGDQRPYHMSKRLTKFVRHSAAGTLQQVVAVDDATKAGEEATQKQDSEARS